MNLTSRICYVILALSGLGAYIAQVISPAISRKSRYELIPTVIALLLPILFSRRLSRYSLSRPTAILLILIALASPARSLVLSGFPDSLHPFQIFLATSIASAFILLIQAFASLIISRQKFSP